MPARIIVGGPAEFSRAMVEACRDSGLSVAAVAVSAADLAEQVETSGALGVVVPVGAGWLEVLAALAPAKRNVVFFAAGNVTREQRDRLADNEVLLLPPDPGRAVRGLVRALERIAPAGYRPRDNPGPVVVNGTDTVAVLRPAMVLFYSLKGGVGKTVTAANVAATVGLWARGLQKTGPDLTVAVLDNNPDGNLAQYFGQALFRRSRDPRNSFADLTPAASREAVLACLDYHAPTNVFFGVSPGAGGRREPEALSTCLALLVRHFHFVFVDLGVRMDGEYAGPAAGYATDVVLVSDTDPRTVSLLYGHREEMTGFFGGLGKFKLVVNHRDPRGETMTARNAAGLLAVPLAAELPYCEQMGKSTGAPVVCREPRGRYAGEVTRLSRRILGSRAVGQAPAGRGPFHFGRLFR